MLMKGIDELDQDGDVKIGNDKTVSAWERFYDYIYYAFDLITPLREKTRLIQIQQDKSVASLFVTFRFLTTLSFFNLFVFVAMFIR